jgi:hypothetical protein
MKYRFQVKDRSRPRAREMIMMMAKHGDNPFGFASDADVKRFFAGQGYEFAALVERCRKADSAVPMVENLVGSTFIVDTSGEGSSVAIIDAQTGEELSRVEGPGQLIWPDYGGAFEEAVRNLKYCVQTASVGPFQSCTSSGVASVEAYIAHRARIYNAVHPDDQFVDSGGQKVSFDTKIEKWIPRMSGGRKLGRGGRRWGDFETLRAFRDQAAIHLKGGGVPIEYAELCALLNRFRHGIAGLLIDLHLHFRERIPCIIVRYAYLGDIELVSEQE